MADDRMLQEALDAARQGQRTRARDLLTRLLRTNQGEPSYWLYLSSVVDTQKERVYCLQTALKLEPENQAARRGLTMMGIIAPDGDIKPVKPERSRQFDIGEIAKAPGSVAESERAKLSMTPRQIAMLVVVGVVAIGLIIYAIFARPKELVYTFPTATVGTRQAELTLTAEGTPIVPTVTPTFEGSPTPIAAFLEVTFTPTAIYVATPHPANEDFRIALSAYEAENWERAIEFFERVLEDEPNAVDILYLIGECYYNLEDFDAARRTFNDALAKNPEFAPAYLGRARVNSAVDPEAKIAIDINDAIRYDPDFIEAYLARAKYRILVKNFEGAMEDLDFLEERGEETALYFLYRAQALINLGEPELAIDYAEQSNELDPTLYDTYLALGQAYYQLGEIEKAIGVLQTYTTFEEESAPGWYTLGLAYVEHEDYEVAIEVLDKARTYQPNLYQARYYRGEAYLGLEQYDLAIEDFVYSKGVYPNWFEPQIAHGIALFLSGDDFEGYKQVNASKGYAETDAQFAKVYYWRAKAYAALGEEYADVEEADWEALLDLPEEAMPEDWIKEAQKELGREVSPPSPTPAPETSPTPTPES
jgi:tetratricopeptide (TPR) repeat protein